MAKLYLHTSNFKDNLRGIKSVVHVSEEEDWMYAVSGDEYGVRNPEQVRRIRDVLKKGLSLILMETRGANNRISHRLYTSNQDRII